MKKNLLFCICLMLTMILQAQDMDIDEIVVRRIAGYIMDHTELSFITADGQHTYLTVKDIPDDVEVQLKSTFGEWHYTNGVLNMAMMIDLAKYTGDEKYFYYAANHVAFGMDNYKFFQKRFRHDRPHYYYPFGQLWTMGELDDCGAMGASMIEVYDKIKRDDYREYIGNTATHITERQERLDDGTLVREFPHRMTIWGDDLYMSVPFLARMGVFSGDKKYFDDAVRQVLDKSDSYTESSCSAMFVYCIARAVNQGWIDKRYASIAVTGWDGLKAHKITVEGQLKDVCVGTGIEDNLVFYYNRPARLNEKHGLGAVIEAGLEVIKLKKPEGN